MMLLRAAAALSVMLVAGATPMHAQVRPLRPLRSFLLKRLPLQRRGLDEAPAPAPPSAACLAAFNKLCPNQLHKGYACHTCFEAHAAALEAAGCSDDPSAECSIGPSPAPGPPGPGPGGAGGNTGKMTWAIENPEPYYDFMRKYFPVQTNVVSDFTTCMTDEDPEDPDACHCWAKMCVDTPDNVGDTCSGPAPTFFQLHAVNAYTRSGNISAFEADWAASLGDLKQVSTASIITARR